MLDYVINPFSDEAKKIVRKSPPIRKLSEDVFELAKKKILWDKNKKDVIEAYDIKLDVLSFYLIFQSVVFKFGYHSTETRTARKIAKELIEERIWHLLNSRGYDIKYGYDEKFVSALMSDLFDIQLIEELDFAKSIPEEELRITSLSPSKEDRLRYAMEWKHLLPVLKARKTGLTDLYLIKGYVLLSLNNLVDFYGETVGILVDEYISRVEKSLKKNIPMDKRLEELSTLISDVSSHYVYMPKVSGKIQRRLKVEYFPPCIAQTLEGVTSGSRNYAITVLLTSFLSYARLAAVGSRRDAKISDYTKDIGVITEEVLPLIYQAAERCSPPLFEDQPLEKMNISYHLGLGLTEDFRIEDAGKSNWYFPPNCDKVRRESPALCKPNDDCKDIKNPLNYYVKKRFPKKEKKKVAPVIRPESMILKGTVIEIQQGSGLIQRCPKCKRRILDNLCVVHGDIEGVEDIRIKATLKQNNIKHWLVLNREVTEKVLDIDLEKAKKLGKDAVLEKIKETLLGKKFQVEGKKLNQNFLVKEIRRVENEY